MFELVLKKEKMFSSEAPDIQTEKTRILVY